MAFRTRFKHIRFEQRAKEKLTYPKECKVVWECFNNRTGGKLGILYYYKLWKRYVVEFKPQIIFDRSCLRDIETFIEQLDKEGGG